MTLYIIIFSIFAFLFIFETFNEENLKPYKGLCLLCCYLLLIFQDGFRWETGSDWMPYYIFFDTLPYATGMFFEDWGYIAFIYPIRLFTDSYTVELIIYAMVFHGLYFYSIVKLSDKPFTTLLFYYALTLPYLGMNRQFLAMALCMVGYVFLQKDKKYMFFLFLALAMTFHKSCLIFLIAWPFRKKIATKYWIVVFCMILAISLSGIINKMSVSAFGLLGETSLDKMDYYTNGFESALGLSKVTFFISLFKRLIWVMILLIFMDRIKNKDAKFYSTLNIYILGSLLYILFSGTIFQIFVGRGLYYYNIMEMLLMPYILSLFKNNWGKLLLCFLLITYSFLNITKGFSNYGENTDYFVPYKGIFINQDYQRQYVY